MFGIAIRFKRRKAPPLDIIGNALRFHKLTAYTTLKVVMGMYI